NARAEDRRARASRVDGRVVRATRASSEERIREAERHAVDRIAVDLESLVLEAQREAQEPELRADAVSEIRAALGVAEEPGVAVRLPARNADAPEEIDERQRVIADGRDRERLRVEGGRGRACAARRRRARRGQRQVHLAEVDVVDLEPDRVERPNAADQLEA